MDLPLHPSVDIYQIHRTPFFRRLHRKDSDEFERLRQAYESVRNFDEKPLEAQVKKIRLGKLLRRIKDSFTSAKNNRQNKPRMRPKSKQQIRREELARARQVGTEYSRRNLNTVVTGFCSIDKLNPLEEWRKEKSRLERRLEYGNTKSLVNRTKIQRLMQRSAESEQNNLRNLLDEQNTSTSRKRLQGLKRSLTKEEFIKFLVHCLSADQLNVEAMRTFEDILQSRNDMYWDLVEAIDQRQQYIKSYGKFMKKLSNLALRGVPEVKQKKTKSSQAHVETFNSKTSIRPNRCQSPEVYIRTYRYSDDDEFLPPPSESLLEIKEDEPEIPSERPEHDNSKIYKADAGTAPTTSFITNKTSSHLSTKLLKTIRTDPTTKNSISKKFGDIIRDTVRKESAVMLHNLEQAIKH